MTATTTLEARAKNPNPENFVDALKAAKALRILRASDTKSLTALCDNIKLQSTIWEGSPLGGYVAAQALVEIGGRPAAQAVMLSMRSPVDREGLLLRAFILRQIDSPELGSERLRIEIEKVEKTSLMENPSRDIYLQNLRQVRQWLNDPMLGNEKNWPCNNQVQESVKLN